MLRISAALIVAAAASTAMADASAQGLLFPFNSADTSGWTQSMLRNDDGSTSRLDLPFTFCFYEQDKTSVFINNNGNLTFDSALSSFTSTGFPIGTPMIAPFWADVDTRSTTGVDSTNTNLVWHKFVDMDNDSALDTLVVTWDGVGYFANNNAHTNTFQVAITGLRQGFGATTNGGFNAAFSFGNMDWTTGSASGGNADGLGGTPATVGINEGTGPRFDQIGRFNRRGNDYAGNGLGGEISGVDYLDGRDYYFDACLGVVPAPSAAALLGLGALAAGRRRR